MATPEELAKEFGVQPNQSTSAVDPSTNFSNQDLAAEFGYDPNFKPPQPDNNAAFWQGLKDDSSYSGLLKKLGIGALRGSKDVLDTTAHGLGQVTSAIADKVLPESLALPIRNSVTQMQASDKEARDKYDTEYPASQGIIPSTTDVGRTIGQIGATLPVMPTKIFAAIDAGMGAAPTVLATGQKLAAPIINRLASATAKGSLGGTLLSAATSSSNDKSLGQNMEEGAVTGALGGPLVVGASQLGKNLAGNIVGKISSTRADLAERAAQLGIDLKATQVANSPTLKKFDQISGMLPFSGAQGLTDTQLDQFTRAVSRTFGQDVGEITPQVISNARKTIGGEMEQIYKGATVKADVPLQTDLTNIVRNAHGTVAEGELRPIITQIRNVISKVDQNGEIPGDAFHALIKYDGMLSKAQQSSNPNISKHANIIRNSLDNALDRSLPAQDSQRLGVLRQQYKSAMTVKDLVEANAEGKVNPLQLMRKVTQSPGGKLRSGDLGELADIGREFFVNPSDSGTPLGSLILNNISPFMHNPLSAVATGAGALMHGAALSDLAGGGLGLTANRLAREAINSKTLRDSIIRTGQGSTFGPLNSLSSAVEPYSSELLGNNRKKQLTIVPPNEPFKLPVSR